MAEVEMTTPELARLLDVNQRLVQKWRAGTTTPGYANMKRLEEALGKPVSWFFTEDTEAAA